MSSSPLHSQNKAAGHVQGSRPAGQQKLHSRALRVRLPIPVANGDLGKHGPVVPALACSGLRRVWEMQPVGNTNWGRQNGWCAGTGRLQAGKKRQGRATGSSSGVSCCKRHLIRAYPQANPTGSDAP